MTTCVVKGCPITRYNAPEFVIVHGFPTIPDMKRKWLDILQVSTVNSASGVCSFHFAEEIKCKTWDKKIRLLRPAMPTEYLTEEEASTLVAGPKRAPLPHPNKALLAAVQQAPKPVCRLCMKSESCISPLFNETEDEEDCWAKKIMKVAVINISVRDNRPSGICIECQQLVEAALTLRKFTEYSEVFFAEADQEAYAEPVNISDIPLEDRPTATIIRKPVERKFDCEKCGRAFRSESVLLTHQYTHTGERPFKCNQCPRGYASKGFLIMHQRQTHRSELPFNCDICGLDWLTESHLQHHVRTHFGEKLYECSLCDEAFDTPASLHLHKRSAHSKPVHAVYNCSICDYKSTNKYTVKIHMFRHTGEKPLQCEQCGRCFGDKHQLRLHIRTHTGERPYKCNVCSKRFTQKCSLTTHEALHSGINRFLCSTCGNRFKLRSRLRTHQKTCSNDTGDNVVEDSQ